MKEHSHKHVHEGGDEEHSHSDEIVVPEEKVEITSDHLYYGTIIFAVIAIIVILGLFYLNALGVIDITGHGRNAKVVKKSGMIGDKVYFNPDKDYRYIVSGRNK